MAVTINFTPIYGVKSKLHCVCYLLEIDEVCILLDCGWNEDYNIEMLQPLERVINRIDLVLISYPDMYHMGALPYVIGKMGLKAPIYGTLPVYRMGQITLYNTHLAYVKNHVKKSEIQWNLDDVDMVFEQFKQLKYSEKLTVKSSGDGIVITPHCAGHLMGGAIWKISKETEEIVYAVDYNHRTEHVLSKTVLDTLIRPTVLITDSMQFYGEQPKLKDRDNRLMKNVVEKIRKGGNVLIPCDSAGRVLELMRVLDQYWLQIKLRDPIVLLHDMSYYVPKAAQAMLEWCNEKITKHFDIGRLNPFQFAHIHIVHSMEDLDKLPDPKVVLATASSLECGYSKELVLRWGNSEKNLILFPTMAPAENTLAAKIVDKQKEKDYVHEVEIVQTVPLVGDELAAHEANERRIAMAEAEQKAKEADESAMENMILGIDEYESDDSNEDDTDISGTTQLRGTYKVGFGQFATPKYPLYYFMEHKMDWDAYGQTINTEDYMDRIAKKKSQASRRQKDFNIQFDEDPLHDTTKRKELQDKTDEEDDDEETTEDAKIVPTKTVHKNVQLNIKATIVSVDFDGLADGRAIKNCISHVKPRKLILVHGTQDTTHKLKEFALKSISYCDAVFTPDAMECVDIESDTNIYKLQIKESLYSSISFEQAGAHEVAYLEALVHFPKDSPIPILQPVEKKQKVNRKPLLISQGNVKLDVVKQVLAREGFQSHFRGGMLVCKDGVILKRTKSNHITVEGVLSETYFRIRSLLYDQYTTV